MSARSGNLSARSSDRVRITAAGGRLGDLRRGDLAWMRLDGVAHRGPEPSSEAALHAAVYRARTDVSVPPSTRTVPTPHHRAS